MFPLLRHFVKQLARGKRMLGLIALAGVPGLVSWLVIASENADEAPEIYDAVIAGAGGATISIAVLVLGAAVMRDEREGGTLPYLFLTPTPRWKIAASAWLASALVASVVVVVGWLIGWLGYGIIVGDWTYPLASLPAYIAAAAGYSAALLPIGYLFGRAVLIGLAYVFVWESILTNVVSGLATSSVWKAALSVFADLRTTPSEGLDEILGAVSPGVGGGLAKILGMVLAGTTICTWAMRTRDAL